jgi:sulfide:quinone oxidoreductase
MPPRVVILGAGFGGLELATSLSEALGDGVDVTLIDKSDWFMFGFAKLDVMFGHQTLEQAKNRTRRFRSPASAASKRRSPRSIRRRAGSPPTRARTMRTSS